MTDPRRRRRHVAHGARIVTAALSLVLLFSLVAAMSPWRATRSAAAAPPTRRRPLVVVVHHAAATVPPAPGTDQPYTVVRRVVRTVSAPSGSQPTVQQAPAAAPVATSHGSR